MDKTNRELLCEYAETKNPKVKEQIILQNCGLIKEIIQRKFSASSHGDVFNDLLQEGMLAISKCVEMFDLNKKTEFSTYSYLAIKNRIINYLKRNTKLIRRSDGVNIPMVVLSEKADLIASPSVKDSMLDKIMGSLTHSEQNSFLSYINRIGKPTNKEYVVANKVRKILKNRL